jgi:hypothetical protein
MLPDHVLKVDFSFTQLSPSDTNAAGYYRPLAGFSKDVLAEEK